MMNPKKIISLLPEVSNPRAGHRRAAFRGAVTPPAQSSYCGRRPSCNRPTAWHGAHRRIGPVGGAPGCHGSPSLGFLAVGAPGAGMVEDQTHDDGVPQLAGPPTTVVTDEPPLGRKAARCVEANGTLVVRPHLERHLVR